MKDQAAGGWTAIWGECVAVIGGRRVFEVGVHPARGGTTFIILPSSFILWFSSLDCSLLNTLYALIVVGVAMDTVQQVESQLIMRHYDGFMKKTRIRGRRG